MAHITSFRPYRYDEGTIGGDAGRLIAPPYDVITGERRAELLMRHEHNVVQLILPDGPDESRYRSAGELFRSWIARGVLCREPAPALYPYAQTFTHPVSGDRIERRGFVAALRLASFSEGSVLPHERTLSGPKADRLQLMLATDANLEAIFGVYPDPAAVSRERLAAMCAEQTPFLTVVDADGVGHRMWRITDDANITALRADLERQRVFIVDGHHRYETALDYQRLMRERTGSDQPAPYDWIMMFLAPSSDPGLVILPTHRVVHAVPGFSFNMLLDQLAPHFTCSEYADRRHALADLAACDDVPAYILSAGDRMVLAVLRADVQTDALFDDATPAVLRSLDVTVLHRHLFERLLGITDEAQVQQRNLGYVKSASDAFAALDDPGTQLVVIMNPTRMEQVVRVAESGHVMPQKSTYFYPKLASGILFNPLWDRP